MGCGLTEKIGHRQTERQTDRSRESEEAEGKRDRYISSDLRLINQRIEYVEP